jgi:hypothetical protein
MPADQIVRYIVFLILTVMTLGGALGVVVSRNLFHSALFLALSFAGVVGYYVLLDAGFLDLHWGHRHSDPVRRYAHPGADGQAPESA